MMNIVLDEQSLKTLTRDIPEKIVAIMEKRNYSERGLGEELGVCQKAINFWKRGERHCSIPEVAVRIHLLARNL